MPIALTIGNFDGVHRGHQALIDVCRAEAGPEGRVHAMFFDPHPGTFFGRHTTPLLTSVPFRRGLLAAHGVDRVDVRTFNSDFANLSPEAFVEEVVVGDHGADIVVVGPDFRFGKGATGTLDTLRTLGTKSGFSLHVVEAVQEQDAVISSTRVRKALEEGAVEEAIRLLGRPHIVEGRVIQGDQRGRTIGFPTANLRISKHLAIPADGVYAVRALVEGQDATLLGMANLGNRPTFDAGRSVEVHLFDFDADLYDRSLRLAFVARLRAEARFDGVDALVAQLQRDEQDARNALQAAGGELPSWT